MSFVQGSHGYPVLYEDSPGYQLFQLLAPYFMNMEGMQPQAPPQEAPPDKKKK